MPTLGEGDGAATTAAASRREERNMRAPDILAKEIAGGHRESQLSARLFVE
jgi:hypothetical protein